MTEPAQRAGRRAPTSAPLLIAVATFVIICLLGVENWVGLSCSVISGPRGGRCHRAGHGILHLPYLISLRSSMCRERRRRAPATVIIAGIGSGMISTAIPVVIDRRGDHA